MGDFPVPPKGLAHYWSSKLWASGTLAAHNSFCTCADPAGHLGAALSGTLAEFFKEKCQSTKDGASPEGLLTTGDEDGSGEGALDLLIEAFEGDTAGDTK
ncbi:ORF2 [Torque teno Tadarida brasiliensis virus]|uniref:ORF2 n=1 Tax=Torque teno Tadarida brasiliensis virus TaxID=1543419 RepID=A0A088MK20_9VIRU|nr:ORF2 [Torque teno Tadarida brasiliensis virus]AIN40975.1 ORF2 [Torque teno Tadarida brasiliensis virus]